MSIPEVPGTSAPLAATTAPPPAVVPASSNIVGGGMPGSVAQTISPNAMVGPVLSTLPPSLQALQSAFQQAQPGSLLSGPTFETPQVPIFAPGMSMPGSFSMTSLSGALPTITIPEGLGVDALASIVGKLALDLATLLKSKRECDIDVEVAFTQIL
jgi:hypothetical protein